MDAREARMATCDRCGHQWDYPTPAGRCPRESEHRPDYETEENRVTYLALAVEKAQEAFFASLASSFPLVKTGDLPPDATGDFYRECSAIAGTWVDLNLANSYLDTDG